MAYRIVTFQGTNNIRELISPRDTNGKFELFEYNIDPGGVGPPLHVHRGADETFLVLEGRCRFDVGGNSVEREAGGVMHVPAGTPHTFRNAGDAPLKMLITLSPALGFMDYFESLLDLMKVHAWPPPAEAIAPLWEKYDTHPVKI